MPRTRSRGGLENAIFAECLMGFSQVYITDENLYFICIYASCAIGLPVQKKKEREREACISIVYCM